NPVSEVVLELFGQIALPRCSCHGGRRFGWSVGRRGRGRFGGCRRLGRCRFFRGRFGWFRFISNRFCAFGFGLVSHNLTRPLRLTQGNGRVKFWGPHCPRPASVVTIGPPPVEQYGFERAKPI